MKARPALALAALLLLLPPLLLWPLPRVGGQALLAAPGFEASSHVWGLWAATRTHQPLLIHTPTIHDGLVHGVGHLVQSRDGLVGQADNPQR